MDKRYGFIFNRLSKLEKSLKNLVEQNEALIKANDILRKNEETYQAREAARERIIQSLDPRETPQT